MRTEQSNSGGVAGTLSAPVSATGIGPGISLSPSAEADAVCP